MKMYKFKVDGVDYLVNNPLLKGFIKAKDGNRLGLKKQKQMFDKIRKATVVLQNGTKKMYEIKTK